MKKKILFVLSLIFGLMFINSGLNKFLNYMPAQKDIPEKMQKMIATYMRIIWLMPLTGVAEILGGLLFIIPKTRALGAVIIFPVMIGIEMNSCFAAPSILPVTSALLAINIWVILENRRKYLPMIQ